MYWRRNEHTHSFLTASRSSYAQAVRLAEEWRKKAQYQLWSFKSGDTKVTYSREQKHVLLFRKSTLMVRFKPRHVTKQDLFIFRNVACLCCFRVRIGCVRACICCLRACICCFRARGWVLLTMTCSYLENQVFGGFHTKACY